MNSLDDSLPRLKVSENRRFLVTESGEPFFWLGDTAWELFHRLTRDEAERYFADREKKRFTVIQAVALAEHDGLNTPNRYGERPLMENDPCRPNEAYFALVDSFIRMAEAHHLYVGLLPTWGDKVSPIWGIGPAVFTPENAFVYGRWLGERYRVQKNVIWIMGGDRPPIYQGVDYRPIYRAMARGIRDGVSASLVMTYHVNGGHSSSEMLRDEPWLDMNMMQSGHGGGRDVPVWDLIANDYALQPARPVLDGEPNYEDHPVSPWPKWDPATGYFRDHDVRKQLYRSVFAGGCGVTYGHHSVWQFYEAGRAPVTFPDRSWREALDRPAACQAQHLRALMEARPFLSRIPDQELFEKDPGAGSQHMQATRDAQGRYAYIYLPETRPVTVRLERLSGNYVQASWFDPKCGHWTKDPSRIPRQGVFTFTPPAEGPDWVLVLDAVA